MMLKSVLSSVCASLTCVCFAFVVSGECETGKVISYETKGNLEVTHVVGCVGFSELSNKLTAADLYGGLSKCLLKGDFDSAAQLFALAGVFATYDKLRVADTTAHQAHAVLTMNAMSVVSAEEKKKLLKNLKEKLSEGTPQLQESCSAVRKIGPPDYHPTYMIQHGIRAFDAKQAGDGIVPNFDSSAAWEKALSTYLHCSAVNK